MSHSRRCGLCSYDKISCSPAFSSICDPCRKLAELEEKIEETRRMLIGFANERQKLKELANYKHDRIIHRLPVEIAANIFELCMPDPQDLMDLDPSHSTISAIPVQLVLSSVCRRWAAIAHSTSRLWTNLVLCANYLKRPWPNPILVEKWLNRSGSLGISIRLHVPDLFLRQYESTEIINVLNRYCDRWLHLTYQGPLFDLLKLGSADTDQPQLRRLRLTVSRPTSSTSEHQTLKLRPKTLDALSATWIRASEVEFDWHQLTQLELEFSEPSDCLEALRNASSLIWCRFQEGYENDHQPPSPLNVTITIHPTIRHLEIISTAYRPSLYGNIFGCLSCPSLETLMLNNSNVRMIEVTLVIEFLRRSRCSLTNLSLLPTVLSTSEIVSLFEMTPKLQHLHIHVLDKREFAEYPGMLFEYLAKLVIIDGWKKPQYLPALRSLVFEEAARDEDSPVHWKEMPDIFGSPVANSYSTERHRHLLESVTFSIRYLHGEDSHPFQAVDQTTMERILWLKAAGVKWVLKHKFGEDEQEWDGKAPKYDY